MPKATGQEKIDTRKGKKSGGSILEKKFAKLVDNTENTLKKGYVKPDPEGFKEFYGTHLEKDAMILQAAVHEFNGDLGTALSIYNELAERFPGSEKVNAGMVHVLLELTSQAILRRGPESAKLYLSQVKARDADSDIYLYNAALVKLMEGKNEEGEKLLKKTSSRFKKTGYYGLLASELKGINYDVNVTGNEIPNELKSAIINHSVIMAIKAGNMNKAQDQLNLALEKKLAGAETYVLLGNVMFRKGLFKESADNYKKSIEINPYIPEAHINLGIVSEIYLEDYDIARKSYSKYLNLGGPKIEEVSNWLKNLELMENKK